MTLEGYLRTAMRQILERAMSVDFMMEFKWKALSTWLSCDDRREKAFTHKSLGEEGRTSQLDSILGPRNAKC